MKIFKKIITLLGIILMLPPLIHYLKYEFPKIYNKYTKEHVFYNCKYYAIDPNGKVYCKIKTIKVRKDILYYDAWCPNEFFEDDLFWLNKERIGINIMKDLEVKKEYLDHCWEEAK